MINLEPTLPFRHENEKTFLTHIHPLTRLFLPLILVMPFLIISDIFLTITIILISFIFSVPARLNLFRIFKRIKGIFAFIVLITIFVPFYVGGTIMWQFNIGITIKVYKEGVNLALLSFLRIFGAIYVFMSFFSSLTYSEFIEALIKLRIVPSFFIGSIVIMIHYIPILASSNKRILEAQELRGKKITSYWEKFKAHAYILGKSIVTNMERSEKLYESLKMRGFSGEITFAKRKLKVWDVIMLLFFFIVIVYLMCFIDLESLYLGCFALFLPQK